MMNLVEKFTPEAVEASDDDGVVAIEYVLMAALVAVVVVGLKTNFLGLGTRLGDVINTVIS